MEGWLPTADTLDARRFHIAVKRLADNLSYGTDRSPFLGSGIEYVQSRTYQYGDPIRAIDWRVTARTGRVFVKEYEAPKRLPCYLLVDTSASMTTSSVARTKYSLALFVAGGIAFACLDRVSPVGVIGVGTRAVRIEPSLSKQQVLQWLHRLRRFRYDEQTTLGRRATELGTSLKDRALVFVLSDLHAEDALPALKLLGQLHDVVVVQLRDPGERSLRGAGVFRAREAETGRSFVTHGRARWLDDEATATQLRRAGVDRFVVDGDAAWMRFYLHGTHESNLYGLPPTGKHIGVAAVDVSRFTGGKWKESWCFGDELGLLLQLGVPNLLLEG